MITWIYRVSLRADNGKIISLKPQVLRTDNGKIILPKPLVLSLADFVMNMFRKHFDNKLVHIDGTKFNDSSAINNEFHLRASFIKPQRIEFWGPSQKEKLETKVAEGCRITGGTLD